MRGDNPRYASHREAAENCPLYSRQRDGVLAIFFSESVFVFSLSVEIGPGRG